MSRYTLKGGCHCGAIRLEVELSRPPATYHPRACDCDFCRKHGAAYLSDPAGTLRIHMRDADGLARYRQGDQLADFLLCKTCGVLVGVTYTEVGRTFATLNRLVIEDGADFAETKPVSPKTLGADEKVGRWKALWISDVELVTPAGLPP